MVLMCRIQLLISYPSKLSTGNIPMSNSVVQFIGDVKNDTNDPDLSASDFDFTENVLTTLKSVFGIHSFRPNQVRRSH